MDELLYKQEVFQLVGVCMEIHRELGKGHDEIIYKDALVGGDSLEWKRVVL
jgi:hypothetical protein